MVNEDPRLDTFLEQRKLQFWNMIYYYPHIFLIRDLCVLIVSLVHRACLIGHNEEETSKPLLFSTRTWSKFETSNPDRLVGPLKFDKLFFSSESESLVLCVNFKSQNLWLQTPLVWVGPWKNGKFGAQNCSQT